MYIHVGISPAKLRRRAAVTIDYRGKNGEVLCFLFHGATAKMLRTVFDSMRPTLLHDFIIDREHVPVMINGRSWDCNVVTAINPVTELLSPQEWIPIIIALFRDLCRTELDYYPNINKFLNT